MNRNVGVPLNAERNVLLLTLIRACSTGGAATVPGLGAFLAPYGLSVWTAEGCFASAMLFAIVPSGSLADRIGRARVLQLGGALLVLGALLYRTSSSVFGLCLAEVLLGAGQGFVLGKDESLLHSSLAASRREMDFARIWGRVVSIEVLLCAGFFGVGDLLSHLHERAPFCLSLACYSVVLCAAWQLAETRAESGPRFGPAELRRAAALSMSPRMGFVFLSYALFTAALRVLFWCSPGYLAETAAPIPVGVLLGAQCVISFVAARRCYALCSALEERRLLRALAATLAVSVCAAGWFSGKASFLFLLAQPLVRALSRVTLTSAMHTEVTARAPELRATLASIRELVYLAVYLALLPVARVFSGMLGTVSFFAVAGGVGVGVMLLIAVFRRYFACPAPDVEVEYLQRPGKAPSLQRLATTRSSEEESALLVRENE